MADRHFENIDGLKEDYGEPDRRNMDIEFELECSDDELKNTDGNIWEPSPEEIVQLLEAVDRDKVLELEWTTPGRRPPTPTIKPDAFGETEMENERHAEEKSDFDFQDEMSNLKISAKAIRPAGSDSGPRGSAKKKTPTSLDAILSNMARHRKLDMMEDDDEDLLP